MYSPAVRVGAFIFMDGPRRRSWSGATARRNLVQHIDPGPAMSANPFEQRRRLLSAASVAAAAALAGPLGCAGGGSSPAPAPAAATRTWRLGFSGLPPRPDVTIALQGIDRWSTRAEIAAIHEELPWTDLLANNMTPDAILDRDKVQLVQYYRGKGLQLFFMADLTDGLSRGEEAPQLRALGRSIREATVQQAYRDYVAAVVRKLRPDYLGLAAETNLIRIAAPGALYAAVVQAANACAADLATATTAPRFISVQVEQRGAISSTGDLKGYSA
jgi:hypothetical protein